MGDQGRYHKIPDRNQQRRWAKIWFQKLVEFHRIDQPDAWTFGAADVIAFLRSHRDAGTPAWKRLKIIKGLLLYRQEFQKAAIDDLLPLQAKMIEIIGHERRRADANNAEIPDVPNAINPNEPDVIQAFRRAVRSEGLLFNTEKAYVAKIKQFMRVRGLKNQADFASVNAKNVESYLSDLAVDGNVAPSTQNSAFHALLKLFQLVLCRDLGEINAIRACKEKPIPTVLAPQEIQKVLDRLDGVHRIIASLLYGCGMRISEALRLRVKDLDFENRIIEIRQSKGGKSRLVPMPEDLVDDLRKTVSSREVVHRRDLEDGVASVWLPYALDRKFPAAHCEFKWQFLFASDRMTTDPRTGKVHRHHLHAETFPRHLRRAVQQAGVLRYVTSHTFRHCYATHLLHAGVSIREIQELLGHADIQTTMIYIHVALDPNRRVQSPLDRLAGAA